MVQVVLETGKESINLVKTKNQTVDELWQSIEVKGFTKENFYLTQNGKLVGDKIAEGLDVKIIGRLVGGKGGFGSMLRAIGAQIEKTTNREACRDLSGRRLRDINEEKRLKAWIEKQADREEEAAERKKKKLERLCAEPKHEFKDKNYEHERTILTERIDDAVEEGFKIAATSVSEEKGKPLVKKKGIKRKTILDDDIDSDELSSSDESEAEGPSKKSKTESEKSDESKEDKSDVESDESKESSDQKSDDKSDKENEKEKEIESEEDKKEEK